MQSWTHCTLISAARIHVVQSEVNLSTIIQSNKGDEYSWTGLSELSKLQLCLNGHSVSLQLQTDDMHELRKYIDNSVFISVFAKSDINILLQGNKKRHTCFQAVFLRKKDQRSQNETARIYNCFKSIISLK